ncbi:hypothetical protein HQN59_24690 [Schlegelella sp. ID0723]|uniref:Uncharacterized protein n=2 Tax=Piscinibacter koreensis TaxID=2742824 RepID=A0A7Y6TZ49_9BURK|nr:hypothetical protein [Schlegelella koreensis]
MRSLLGKGELSNLEVALCYFFGDQIKALIAARWQTNAPGSLVENNSGPTIAEREAEIDANDDRLTAIDEELASVQMQFEELKPHAAVSAR